MRRWWFLVVSLLFLGFVLVLRQFQDALRFVVSPDAGAVLYATTFTDGRFAEHWSAQDRRGGTISFDDHALRLTFDEFVPSQSLLRSINRYPFSDFDLQVTAQALTGPLDNSFGIVFRQLDDQTYYLFYISSDGYYSVWRETPAERFALSTWIPTEAINQGADGSTTNTLRVVAEGNIFRFFVNDEPLQLCIPDLPDGESTYTTECVDGTMQPTLSDDTIPYGRIGVAIETLRDGGMTVQFDDVLLRSLSDS